MILSGMSDFEQMQKNVKTFETEKTLDGKEMDALLGIADAMLKKAFCHVPGAGTAPATALRDWIFPRFWNSTMSTALPRADL